MAGRRRWSRPEITSVVDRRRAQSDRVLSVLGEADEAPQQKRARQALFGRRTKEQRSRKRQEKQTKMTSEIYYPEQRHLLAQNDDPARTPSAG